MTRIFYATQTGNTKKVANAMGEALGIPAEPVDSAGAGTRIAADILFVGGAVYATYDHGIRPELTRFISGLDPAKIGKAVIFCTGFEDRAVDIMKLLLEMKGIAVAKETFFCKGRFFLFNLGHPSPTDLERAMEFARRIAGEVFPPKDRKRR
jgi:flavodoxin